MTLRPYQQAVHDAAWKHVRSGIDPCLIEAATGAGKSHIIGGTGRAEPLEVSGKRSQGQHV